MVREIPVERSVRVRLSDQDFVLESRPGLFSHQALDPGTDVLLRVAPPPSEGDVLDLGCGYGPIAISLALRAPDATLWAIDVDDRAIELTERNAATMGLKNVRVLTPRQVPIGQRFDAIYSNPPFRLGKDEQRALLTGWLDRLGAGGQAFFVIKRNYGADSIQDWLTRHGYPTDRFASKRGYRVLRARSST
jgi:16S rRNA (guanine1207-N2)-methyltransferase